MRPPCVRDARVDRNSLVRRFDAEEIRVVIALGEHRTFQVNHGSVAIDLLRVSGSTRSPVRVLCTRPIGESIDRSPIAEGDCGALLLVDQRLELPLNTEDRTLRRSAT